MATRSKLIVAAEVVIGVGVGLYDARQISGPPQPANLVRSQAPHSLSQMSQSGEAIGANNRGNVPGVLSNPDFNRAIQALERRTGSEMLDEPEVTTTSGRELNQMRLQNLLVNLPATTTNWPAGK